MERADVAIVGSCATGTRVALHLAEAGATYCSASGAASAGRAARRELGVG